MNDHALAPSSPHIDARVILQGFGDVRRGNGIGFGEIGDGARELEDAMEGASRELQALGGSAQERLGGGLDLAEGADFGGSHLGVDAYPLVACETPHLPLTRRQRAMALGADDSASPLPVNFSYSTRGTSTWE